MVEPPPIQIGRASIIAEPATFGLKVLQTRLFLGVLERIFWLARTGSRPRALSYVDRLDPRMRCQPRPSRPLMRFNRFSGWVVREGAQPRWRLLLVTLRFDQQWAEQ